MKIHSNLKYDLCVWLVFCFTVSYNKKHIFGWKSMPIFFWRSFHSLTMLIKSLWIMYLLISHWKGYLWRFLILVHVYFIINVHTMFYLFFHVLSMRVQALFPISGCANSGPWIQWNRRHVNIEMFCSHTSYIPPLVWDNIHVGLSIFQLVIMLSPV